MLTSSTVAISGWLTLIGTFTTWSCAFNLIVDIFSQAISFPLPRPAHKRLRAEKKIRRGDWEEQMQCFQFSKCMVTLPALNDWRCGLTFNKVLSPVGCVVVVGGTEAEPFRPCVGLGPFDPCRGASVKNCTEAFCTVVGQVSGCMTLSHPFFCRASFEGLFQVLLIPWLPSFCSLGCPHTAYRVRHPPHPIIPLGSCIQGVALRSAGLFSAALMIDAPFLERNLYTINTQNENMIWLQLSSDEKLSQL